VSVFFFTPGLQQVMNYIGCFSRGVIRQLNRKNSYIAILHLLKISSFYKNIIVCRKYLLFFMVVFHCTAQSQSNYILNPTCRDTTNKPLVVFFTGDGGRSSFDKKIEDSFCANNMPLMGINSYKYFSTRKTPQQTLDSILPYINMNLNKFNRQKFILAGSSFGSEVVPFLYNLMSDEWKTKVEFLLLISPSDNSDFKIHFLDQLGLTFRHWPYNVLSEIMKIDAAKIIVFWGEDEKKFEKEEFTKHNITVYHLKGGHRHTKLTPVFEKIIEDIKADTVR
jgi:type IV secretory pathway VirJ component